MNNRCVKVLPFQTASIKPPRSVLKQKIELLEGFPRNLSRQLETDSEVFALAHECVCTCTRVCLVLHASAFVLEHECVWWDGHPHCRAALWWFVRAVNSSAEALWQTFMCENWVVLLTETGYLAVPVLPLLWRLGEPAFCLHPLSPVRRQYHEEVDLEKKGERDG